MSARFVSLVAGLFLSPALFACGSNDADEPETEVALVDAKDAYGKSYEEWSLDWVSYVNSASPPACTLPLMDDTGADCALYQDESSPVFFLAGNYGGTSVRNKCVAPADKALFFPLVNAWGDNAGVPADMLLSDADIKAYVDGKFATVETDSLHLSVDGQALGNLTDGVVPSAQYTLQLAPMANSYYCSGIDGVEGEMPGYVAGYWAMLAPLAAGKHAIEFGGTAKGTSTTEDEIIEQTYSLTVR